MARTSPVLGGRALMEGARSKDALGQFAAICANGKGKESRRIPPLPPEYGPKSSATRAR